MNNDKIKILFIEDDENFRNDTKEYFKERIDSYGNEYELHVATKTDDALKMFEEKTPDAILCDLDMTKTGGGKLDGIKILNKIRGDNYLTPFIMFTCTDNTEVAEKCFEAGADDYMVKTNIKWEGVLFKLKLIIRLKKETKQYRDSAFFNAIATKNPNMLDLINTATKFASSNASILLTGESGTGKELFASCIHNISKRNGKFIKFNIAALPETVIESELFGHEKGAFTGAHAMRRGRFELAHGGTIFLDEIGDSSPNIQVKLLRILQEKEFERVGGNTTISTDVRVISATNKSLEELIDQGQFRQDLYYRLSVTTLHILALRDRRDDIPLLINHFIKKFNMDLTKTIIGADPTTLNKLCLYDWPGNIRELQNIIERAVILCEDNFIMEKHLPPTMSDKESSGKQSLNDIMAQTEKSLIENALKINNGLEKETAQFLGIKVPTLKSKKTKHKLRSMDYRS